MNGPVVGIVGSPCLRDDSGNVRKDAAALQHAAKVRAAAAELGAALARGDCGLLVYSADEDFIEGDVVKAYCSESNSKETPRIDYRHPKDYTKQFAEQTPGKLTRSMFSEQRDTDPSWEASFYRSLQDADGILLIGGGASTTIAGHVGLVLDRPVAPVACFGGGAESVFPHVDRGANGPTKTEREAMLAWEPGSAQMIVESLSRRHEERKKRLADGESRIRDLESKVKKFELAVSLEAAERRAGLLLVGAALLLALFGFLARSQASGTLGMALFTAALAAAGASGAAVHMLQAPLEQSPFKAILLGCAAGVVFSILYIIPQIAGSGSSTLVPATAVQFALEILVAFGAGMAADAVLDAFRRKTISRAPEIVDNGYATQIAGASPAETRNN